MINLGNQHKLSTQDINIKNALVQEAIEATKDAYAVYSNYPVGAALLTASGKIYRGCNIENASYGLTSCAERNAVFKSVSAGERELHMIALVTQNGGFPCGACRQVMYEFNPNLPVIVADMSGNILKETTVSELLPHAFGPNDL